MDTRSSVPPERAAVSVQNSPRQGAKRRTRRQRRQQALFDQYRTVVYLEAASIHRRVPSWVDLDSLTQ